MFSYRGVYVRHLGPDQAVAEANQVLFFNATEGYRVSHPVPGGDASLTLVISELQLREMAPRAFLRDGPALAFRRQRLRIDGTRGLVWCLGGAFQLVVSFARDQLGGTTSCYGASGR